MESVSYENVSVTPPTIPSEMPNLISNTSDASAQLVANVGVLLVLVGEKHVKAYFKTMHKPSHHLLFAASPIGLVTAVTTLIRLSGAPMLKRMIGRQFEPRAQVLLDVTSVSSGPVGLELVNGSLEQCTRPDPGNVASFWIHGEKSGTADELIAWTKRIAEVLRVRVARQNQPSGYSCYDRRAGLASASALRGRGPGAVWIAREKALGCLEEARTATSSSGEARELKLLCHEECTRLDPNLGSTACEGVGLAIAQWTDVSPVLTASENLEGRVMFDTSYYDIVLFFLCCNVGVVVVIGVKVGLAIALCVGGGLLVTSAGSWLTARLVDSASEEESVDLSCFCATAAGFVSRENMVGVRLPRCPKRVVISHASEGPHPSNRKLERVVTLLVVVLMVVGFIVLYLSLRESPWWASFSVLGVAALGSCARSLLDPSDVLESGAPAVPYFSPGGGGSGDGCALNLPDQHPLPVSMHHMHSGMSATTSCSFPSDAAEPLVFSDSYAVLVPVLLQLEGQAPWEIRDKLMKGFFFRALQLAHGMRVRSIAPWEAGRFGHHPLSNRTVFLYSDVLVPDRVLRQPMEVLVSSWEASEADLMLEAILVAVFAVANQAFRLPGCEMGGATLDLGLNDARDYQVIDGRALKTITWEEGRSWRAYSPLTWVAAKIIYVTMLSVAEETMMEMGKEWFGGCEVLSRTGVDGFLDSMEGLKLAVEYDGPMDEA